MIINHNMSAEFANRLLGLRVGDLDKDIEHLSSGLRINRAGDDASGMAVSEKLSSQVRGLQQASKNAQDGISFIQTTEGYLQNTEDALQRVRELAVQAANGVYSDEDRMQIQTEVSQMVDEIDRVASFAQFNGMNMLTGRFSTAGASNSGLMLHVGANMDQRLKVNVGNMSATALGVKDGSSAQTSQAPAAAPAGGATATPASTPAAGTTPPPQSSNGMANGKISILTANDANMTIGRVDEAIKKVLKQRAELGAYQNRLSMTIKGIDTGAENLMAAQSRIQDADMARSMSSFAKNQILVQSASAMIAQANQKNQAVMRILG